MRSIFMRRTPLGLVTLSWCLVCLLLMHFDSKLIVSDVLRRGGYFIVAPARWLASRPGEIWDWLRTETSTHQKLLKENSALHTQLRLLEAKLNRLEDANQEAKLLQSLLSTSLSHVHNIQVAQLIALHLTPYQHIFLLDRGAEDGVYKGQPVLDRYGIVGQIVAVESNVSRVMLITDKRAAVPVVNRRTGLRGIVAGTGDRNQLALRFVPDMTDVREGDQLYTTGLGQRFPAGYPVGRISKVSTSSNRTFMQVIVNPIAMLLKSHYFLLVKPNVQTKKGMLSRSHHPGRAK